MHLSTIASEHENEVNIISIMKMIEAYNRMKYRYSGTSLSEHLHVCSNRKHEFVCITYSFICRFPFNYSREHIFIYSSMLTKYPNKTVTFIIQIDEI